MEEGVDEDARVGRVVWRKELASPSALRCDVGIGVEDEESVGSSVAGSLGDAIMRF